LRIIRDNGISPTVLFQRPQKGQLDFVLNAIHDEIEFISYSPIKVFPFLGHRRGKPAMAEALHSALDAFEVVSPAEGAVP
jgi:hypothetical protein